MINIGEALKDRGHNVSVMSFSYENCETMVTEREMNFISIGSFPVGKKEHDEIYKKTMEFDLDAFLKSFRFQVEPIVKYINDLNLTVWDIIVVDDFSSNAVACMAKKQGVPIISLSPRSDALPTWINLSPWVTPLTLFYPVSENMNLIDRLATKFLSIFFTNFHDYVFWELMYPPLIKEECKKIMYSSASDGFQYPLMLSSVIGFEPAHTISPLMHYTGPMVPKNIKSISGDLENWLNMQGPRQCILISMGSMLVVTPEFANQIVKAIENSNYSVVWSLRQYDSLVEAGIRFDPVKMYIAKWIPQLAVMHHDSIGAAVLHGGAGGINDALYAGVPIVCMPYGGDQTCNCFRVQDIGAGIALGRQQQTAEKINESIQKMFGNKSYQDNALRIGKMFKFAGGVDKAVELIELYSSVGYDHLIPSFVKYNWSWIQYRNLDVYATIVLAILVSGSLFFCCVKNSRCCKKKRS